MKIRQKLTLGFVGIALLVAVVGYVAVKTSQDVLTESIGKGSVALVTQVLNHIESDVYARIEHLQAYAERLANKPLLIRSNQVFEELDHVPEYIEQQDQAWRAAGDGHVTDFMAGLINNELSEDIRNELELSEFYQEKYGHEVFAEVFVTNRYGANAGQSQKTSDYYQADETWWQKARQDGLYVADVAYDPSAAVYSVDICVRIDDENGNFLGVMKAVSSIDRITHIVDRAAAEARDKEGYRTVQFKLLTRDWRVIYSTQGYEFLESLPPTLSASLENLHDSRHSSGHPGMTNAVLHKDENLFACVHSQGHRDYAGLGWTFMVSLRTREVLAPVLMLRNRILLIAGVITAAAILLGFILANTISAPIDKLSAAVSRIGAGKLTTHIESSSNDEVGQLAATFNQMAEDLKRSTTSIGTFRATNRQLNDKNQQLEASRQQLREVNQKLESEINERKQTEDKLRENESKYKSLFQYSGDACFIMSVSEEDGARFTDCNETTLTLFGCTSRDQIIDQGPDAFSPPTQPDGMPSEEKARQLTLAAISGNPQRFEWEHHRLDGTTFWVDVSLCRIDIKGQPSLQGVVRDITKRKERENNFGDVMAQAKRMNQLMTGREQRIIEMKQEVNALLGELGRPAQYESVLEDDESDFLSLTVDAGRTCREKEA